MNFIKTVASVAAFVVVPLTAHSALLLDLNAEDLALTDGATVASWDIANASGTPTFRENQTPGGFAAVEFNGSDHFGQLAAAQIPASGTGDLIFAGLIKATNTGGYHNLIDDDAQNRPMLWIDPAFRYELNFAGGGGSRGVGNGLDGWDVVIANSRTNQLWINSATPNASGGGAVGYYSSESFDLFNRDGGQTFQGLVADFRVYNDAAAFGGDYAALHADLASKLVAPVPGPATPALMILGILALGFARIRRC